MKHTFLFLLVVGLLFSSCKKEVDVPDPSLNRIFGTWEFKSSSGGFSGAGLSSNEMTSENQLLIEKNGKMTWLKSGKKDKSAYFTFKKGTAITQSDHYVLTFKKHNELDKVVFFLSDDQLYLNDNVYDGYSYAYQRK